MSNEPRGVELLRDPMLNKGSAFTEEERDRLALRGLLPPRVFTQQQQSQRVMANFRRKTNDLEKYIFLIALQDRNETLFYSVLQDHIEEMMPIIYTPTVGQACQEYAHIFRRSRGLYVSIADRGKVAAVLENWPIREVGVIVVTDGERILGLGDLGTNGMGIPVGKLSLYTACAGIDPARCLPITLDVGTNNEELLADPLYMGSAHPRVSTEEFDALLEEFIEAVEQVFPGALIQFEDFGNHNAFRMLRRYRDRVCCFNDDIQGTASVTLAGILSALRLTGGKLVDQRLVFLGAGEAGIGIANLIVSAMIAEGADPDQARRSCWFLDSKGLVVSGRDNLQEHKLAYAHDHAFLPDLISTVETLRPTTLVGVSGQPQTFTQRVVEEMSRLNYRPVILALSNPTSKAECTAGQAYRWSGGRAIFASGSPFDPVELDGKTHVPGQGNNAYIFPGVGLGVVTCGASRVTDEMFSRAATVLADQVSAEELQRGCIYPSLTRIRDVSAAIACAVIEVAYAHDPALPTRPRPDDIEAAVRAQMYHPSYA